jgi:hypothetical protein
MRIVVRVNGILNLLKETVDLEKFIRMVEVLALRMLPEGSVSFEDYHNAKKPNLGIGQV